MDRPRALITQFVHEPLPSRLREFCDVVSWDGEQAMPRDQLLAALRDGAGLIVGHVIHLPAEGVEGGHAIAFGFRQQNESQRQIRRALPRDRPALLHGSGLWVGRVLRTDGRQTTGFSEGRVARAVFVPGVPPVAASLVRGGELLVFQNLRHFVWPGRMMVLMMVLAPSSSFPEENRPSQHQ